MPADTLQLASASAEVEQIDVAINYDIIRLFSEGLYQSPNKAIEELVSNGYDAGAQQVHVILPQKSQEGTTNEPLWVIDDGNGMDASGFHQLWRIAESNKSSAPSSDNRLPIGQFGIGKLAAYVLAWRLIHISRANGRLLLTEMNFHDVTQHQTGLEKPVQISLYEVDEATAKAHMADIKDKDPEAWNLMFGGDSSTWTAVAMTEFKSLYDQLTIGRLRWVLSTGLPLLSDFKIKLNGEPVLSSKVELERIRKININEDLSGIGKVTGEARVYGRELTFGKSAEKGRSHGFFIRVRGRVINLEDELFGIPQPNHAVWVRSAIEIKADGLQKYLLSSREGVRNTAEIREFREFLLSVVNKCRSAYDQKIRGYNVEANIEMLRQDNLGFRITDPLVRGVRSTIDSQSESFYIKVPKNIENEDPDEWLETHGNKISEAPFDDTKFEAHGRYAPAIRYDPATRILTINSDHPFVDKLVGGHKQKNSAKLFALSEILIEGQLLDQRIDKTVIADFLTSRDKTLRLVSGEFPLTAQQVLSNLEIATQDSVAMERAVGESFRVLGFKYDRKGRNQAGPDGVLSAHLGRHRDESADYKLVYDAKQTDSPSVPADKIDLAALNRFRIQEQADFGFFVASEYAAENSNDGTLNQKINQDVGNFLTLLKVAHLQRLVKLHYHHGITLTELRSLFEKSRTVQQVDEWIKSTEHKLSQQGNIPLGVLLTKIEEEKTDPIAKPNINAVRTKAPELKKFAPERLIARLKAVESIIGTRWLEVDTTTHDVLMHQTAPQILAELDRAVNSLATTDSAL